MSTSAKPRESRETELSGLHPRCSTSPSIECCSWLQEDRGLPFYLWDRVSRRTIEVSSPSERLKYTAISHTWGLWEIKEAGQVKKAEVHGVDGWEVPESTLFDVTSLPTIILRVPTSTQSVWLDLVRIPQDRSPRALDEISRQAAIFKNAEHAIIWLNNVESWDGLHSALMWMSLVYLDVDDNSVHNTSQPPTGLFNDKNCTGLFEHYDYTPSISRKDMNVCGWFSSLWTVQEVCLRPDM